MDIFFLALNYNNNSANGERVGNVAEVCTGGRKYFACRNQSGKILTLKQKTLGSGWQVPSAWETFYVPEPLCQSGACLRSNASQPNDCEMYSIT
jgi:hypothetical protein